MALWGTLLGAMTLGRPGDRFGSRDVLKFVGVLYLVASLGAAFAWDLPSFLVFRFRTGIAIGGSSVLAPVYIAEVAPAASAALEAGRRRAARIRVSRAIVFHSAESNCPASTPFSITFSRPLRGLSSGYT